MQLEIRAFEPADFEAFCALRCEALKASPHTFAAEVAEEQSLGKAQWLQKLCGPESATFLAYSGGKAEAMCGVYSAQRKRLRHKAYLWGMYVSPALRGKGIGQKLLEECKQWATAKKKKNLLLAVMQNNTRAIGLYEHFGFLRYGTEPASIAINGVFYDDALFYLPLASQN